MKKIIYSVFILLLILASFLYFNKSQEKKNEAIASNILLSIKLDPGWNMISTEVIVNVSELTNDCPDINGPWEWKNNKYAKATTLSPFRGYWVNSKAACVANVQGIASQGVETFDAGWNLISSPIKNNWYFINHECQLESQKIYAWSNIKKQYNELDVTSFLWPNTGYWIKTTNSCYLMTDTVNNKIENVITGYSQKKVSDIADILTQLSLKKMEENVCDNIGKQLLFSGIRKDIEPSVRDFYENTLISIKINSAHQVINDTEDLIQKKPSILTAKINENITQSSVQKLALINNAEFEIYEKLKALDDMYNAKKIGICPLISIASAEEDSTGDLTNFGPCGDEDWDDDIPKYYSFCSVASPWNWAPDGWGNTDSEVIAEVERKEQELRDDGVDLSDSCGGKALSILSFFIGDWTPVKTCTGPTCEAEDCKDCRDKAYAFAGGLYIPLSEDGSTAIGIPLCFAVGYVFDSETSLCSVAHPQPEPILNCLARTCIDKDSETDCASGQWPPEEITCEDTKNEECLCPMTASIPGIVGTGASLCLDLGFCPNPFPKELCGRLGGPHSSDPPEWSDYE